ncbi:hypothetical protein [Amycolatopsis sp. cmx-4-83]|uniref:hypothetical protein n=1 Tax=Amycolatopsis sp. cmx-4-83 TaxID=2790940 RepID=UPI00397853F8
MIAILDGLLVAILALGDPGAVEQRLKAGVPLLLEPAEPAPIRVRGQLAHGVIGLLGAQPLSRSVRLAVDDLSRDGDQVLRRLGEPPSPVAELLLAWISGRDNMNSATNPNSRWLFPGRRAGQPVHPRSLDSAFSLTMPAPVVADAFGYHPVTTTEIATQAGPPGTAAPQAITMGTRCRRRGDSGSQPST